MGDTIATLCDLSAALCRLPSTALRDLFLRVSRREFLKGASPTDMLKVFISEHLCDDVEDRFGPYSDRQLTSMAGKDFMLILSFDKKLGIESLEVMKFISSRLVYWNRYYENILRDHARQQGIHDLLQAFESPQPTDAKFQALSKKWWQFGK